MGTSASCECPAGFEGDYCEKAVESPSPSPSPEDCDCGGDVHRECVEDLIDGSVSCECEEGWEEPVVAGRQLDSNELTGGDNCLNAAPICIGGEGEAFSFRFASEGSITSGTGDNFGCLKSHPGEQWFYFAPEDSGRLDVISESTDDSGLPQDHDYAVWGPFDSIEDATSNCGSLPEPVSCSYSAEATERVTADVEGGKVYLYLLTNYANVEQTVQLGAQPENEVNLSCNAVKEATGFTTCVEQALP